MFGGEITIDGTVDGDVIAFGGIIEINGVVTGDLMAAGAGITVNGQVLDDVRAAGSGIVIAGAVGDDLIVAGGGGLPGMPIQIGNRSVESGIRVTQDATVGGDAIIAGDRGLINGEIARNLFAGMNSLTFNGRVGGNAQLHAQTLVIGNGAEVGGTLSYSSAADVPMPADVADAVVVQPWQEADVVEETPGDRGRDLTTQFGWWLLRTILVATGLALAGWLILSFASTLIQKPAAALDAKPAEAVIFGFLAIAISFPIVAALVFMGGIFWGFPGGMAMFTLSFGVLTTIWLLSPLVTGLWLGRKALSGFDKERGMLAAMLIGALTIVIVGRVFLLVPCAGPVAFGLIFLLSFAFALGGGLLSLTSRAGKTPLQIATTEPAVVESADLGAVEDEDAVKDEGATD